MCIAVDGMGGDRAPRAPAVAAAAAAHELGVRVLLVGDERVLEDAYVQAGLRRPDNVDIIHAPQVIAPDEAPVAALRHKRDSSLAVGFRLVKSEQASALVSAGSTGVLLVGGALELGRLPGIDRPALCALLPTLDEKGVVFLDVGASTDVRPRQLAQFAVMGSVYARAVLGRPEPRVGLLNIGTEPTKGTESVRTAYALLQAADLHFVGNAEARDLFSGRFDVVVADGFVGNIVLKNTEGVAEAIFAMLRPMLGASLRARVGALLLRPALRQLRSRLDYTEHGGAPLLGLAGACVKCHGSSNAKALANGIAYAARYVKAGTIELMRAALQALADES